MTHECKIEKEYMELEELEKYRPPSAVKMGMETGLSRYERFLLNKQKSKRIDD